MNGKTLRDPSGSLADSSHSYIGMTAAGLTSGTGSASILKVQNLTKHFPVRKGLLRSIVGYVKAVDGVTFDLKRGETLGLVGESGCGKTTLGRCVLNLERPSSGRVIFDGANVTTLTPEELRPFRRNMQIIFQDPFSSLNPRMTVLDIVGEAMVVHGLATRADVEKKVVALMGKVGLPGAWINRYPHEFSGGQRQRIGIARALALNPKLIVCDEPVSALDVSIQAQVLNLLMALREEMNLSYLFIAHNLGVVKHISHRVAVMYLGKIVEIGTTESVFSTPSHPYTQALLSAIPHPDPHKRFERTVLQGDVPSPLNPPMACAFHPRCPAVMERCRLVEPGYNNLGGGHFAKCYLSSDIVPQEGWYDRLMRKTNEMTSRNRERAAAAASGVSDVVSSGVRYASSDKKDRSAEPEAIGAEVRGQGSGIRGQGLGVGGQGSGVGIQGEEKKEVISESRGTKMEGAVQESLFTFREPLSGVPEPPVAIVGSQSAVPEPPIAGTKPIAPDAGLRSAILEPPTVIAETQASIPEPLPAIFEPPFPIPEPRPPRGKRQAPTTEAQSAIRDPQSAICNPQSAIRNPQFKWGWGMLIVGSISLLAGFHIVGWALALVGFGYCLFPRLQNKARWVAGVLAVLLLCAWIGHGVELRSKRASAWKQYGAISNQIDNYKKETGEYPESLQRLGWRLYEVFGSGQPNDPWGHPWQYRYPVKDWLDRPSYYLFCMGPDGKADTADDILIRK